MAKAKNHFKMPQFQKMKIDFHTVKQALYKLIKQLYVVGSFCWASNLVVIVGYGMRTDLISPELVLPIFPQTMMMSTLEIFMYNLSTYK